MSHYLDNIIGQTPDFALRTSLQERADAWLPDVGQWTHLEGLDDDGRKCLELMAKVGLADVGEAVAQDGSHTLTVYRRRVPA